MQFYATRLYAKTVIYRYNSRKNNKLWARISDILYFDIQILDNLNYCLNIKWNKSQQNNTKKFYYA